MSEWTKSRLDNVLIQVFQQDWIPGFAAFLNDEAIDEGKAHIALNLGAFLALIELGEIERKDLPYVIAASLMHEVVHVFEAWAGVEFSEEKVEALLTKYRASIGEETEPHCARCENRILLEQPDYEVTKYCHQCAQIRVEELEEGLRDLLLVKSAAKGE